MTQLTPSEKADTAENMKAKMVASSAIDRAVDALVLLTPSLQIEVMGTLLGNLANQVEHEHITPKYFCALAWARASQIVTGVPAHAE